MRFRGYSVDREIQTLFKVYLLKKNGFNLDEIGVPKKDRAKVVDGINTIIKIKAKEKIKRQKINDLNMRFKKW